MEPTRLRVSGTPARAASAATPSATALACGFELRIDFAGVVLQIADGRDAGGHGQRIAAERSGLVDGAERRKHVHEAELAAEDADGQAAADNLAQRHEVGIERVKLARAAEGDAEAGHDFIDDEQRAVLLR